MKGGTVRNITLADDFGTVRATLWDDVAQQFTAEKGQQVIVSNVIVEKDFYINRPCLKVNDIKSIEVN